MNNFGLKRILLLLASFLTAIWAVMIAFLPWDNDVVYIILSAVVFITIGILYSAGFFIDKMLHYRPGWVLSTGLACFIVGIYLLFSVNSDISQVFVSMSMLLMFTGITLLSQSVQYRFLEIRYWFIYSLFGFVFIASIRMFGIYYVCFRSLYTSLQQKLHRALYGD